MLKRFIQYLIKYYLHFIHWAIQEAGTEKQEIRANENLLLQINLRNKTVIFICLKLFKALFKLFKLIQQFKKAFVCN